MPETEKINSESGGLQTHTLVGKLTLGEVLGWFHAGVPPEIVAERVGYSRNGLRDKLAALGVKWETKKTFTRDLVLIETGFPVDLEGYVRGV